MPTYNTVAPLSPSDVQAAIDPVSKRMCDLYRQVNEKLLYSFRVGSTNAVWRTTGITAAERARIIAAYGAAGWNVQPVPNQEQLKFTPKPNP